MKNYELFPGECEELLEDIEALKHKLNDISEKIKTESELDEVQVLFLKSVGLW